MNQHKVIIDVKNVSKTYKIYHKLGRGWLKSILFPSKFKKRFYKTVEALNNICLTLHKGEVLGIIGPNGSGKSTLLKIISGLSSPTQGKVLVNGKVRALLSLGINFHPSFTGRENIVFGSMAMGISQQVTMERMEEIIDFSELKEYIDVPIQFYSNGMRSRLAASVAFQDIPEVLIIDEALAAGDGYFVSKCQRRIEDICSSGSTVLFVSHGIGLVERLCSRAILLDKGRLI
ncbi:MAG: ABC transporter ATP-binding protein, partial [Symploca sp. SIO2E6]|nr:ABC transporter ATP-binding protein [Symploca sp. SIO2E6]